jgi:hypothetical protein
LEFLQERVGEVFASKKNGHPATFGDDRAGVQRKKIWTKTRPSGG